MKKITRYLLMALIIFVSCVSISYARIYNPSGSGGGSGDVTSVGDCASGACYDGSSDGGTYARLYDGNSNYTSLVSSDISSTVTITMPATTGTLVNSDVTTLSSLVSIGTIATGTWQATDVGVAYGGTGASTLTDGGVLVGSGANAITALTVGTNGQLLIGSTGADPVFATLNCADSLTCTTGAGTLEIDVDDDFLKNDGDTGTGVYDFGGADSFEIPNAASPTVDAAGEIAVDTTNDQTVVYGSAKRVIDEDGINGFCWPFASSSDIVSGDYMEMGAMPYDVTFYYQTCKVQNGTTQVVNLSDSGTNDMTSITCAATRATSTPSTNNTFTLDEDFRIEFGTNTGNVKGISYCGFYRIDAK